MRARFARRVGARMRTIDINADLGEGYGPWRMGDDAALLDVVTSANVACGGHAGDADTMVETLALAGERGVVAGAHPGYNDREGFGRRVIPLTGAEVERLVATQIGALMGAAALAGAAVRFVKPHGALSNVAMDDRGVADAIARAVRAVSPALALLAISGTELEAAGHAAGLDTYSEVFADRGYLATGRLVPRARAGALIHDADAAGRRLVEFLATGRMPTVDGAPVRLDAHSVCVHGDSDGAIAMARRVRDALESGGVPVRPFLAEPARPGP